MRATAGRSRACEGFTYVWLLVAIAIMAAGLAAIGEVAATAAKREKEAELLFVGDQFARAIAEYAANSRGEAQYPQSLDELVADKRYPNVRRYLRRVYADPLTGRADWGLIRGPGGGIVGVHSQSLERPLKTANFPAGYASFTGAATYTAWRFTPSLPGTFVPGQTAPAAKAGQGTTGAAPRASGVPKPASP
jgi:type II secretory pathway pseudopilin PulG